MVKKLSELTFAHWLVILGTIYFLTYFFFTKLVYHWFWMDVYDLTKIFLVVIAIVYTVGKLNLLKLEKNT